MKYTIAIVGSTGFIGTNLCKKLQTDCNLIPITRSMLDLRDESNTIATFKKIQPHIIVNAAHTGVNSRIDYSSNYLYDNLKIVTNILEGARHIKQLKKIIFLGSSLEYQDTKIPIDEKTSLQPKNVYATTKMLSSMLSLNLARQWGLPFLLLRPFNLYGPYDTKSVICYIGHSLLKNRSVKLTKGEQYRDYLFIDDFVAIFKQIISHISLFDNYDVFNIGSGKATQLSTIFKTVYDIMGRQYDYEEIPYPQNEYWHNVADITKIKTIIDFPECTPTSKGVERTLLWIQQSQK